MSEFPPWDDDVELKKWTIRQLDEEDDEDERVFLTEYAIHLPGIPKPPEMRARELLESHGLEYRAPKRRRGRPRNQLPNMVDEFVLPDVVRIRALWRRHYGRQNRRMDQISAEEIAAERYLGEAANKKKVRELTDQIFERSKRSRKSPH